MRTRLRTLITLLAGLALLSSTAAVELDAVQAYTGSPPWTVPCSPTPTPPQFCDAYAKGDLGFFDGSGTQIYGGSDINYVADYLMVVTSTVTAPTLGATKATIVAAAPNHSNTVPSTWATNDLQGNYQFSPVPALTPSPISSTGKPFIKLDGLGSAMYDNGASALSLDSTTGYQNTLEIRMQDSGVGVSPGSYYWRAVIEFNPPNALTAFDGLQPGEWRQLYPTPPVLISTAVSAPTLTQGGVAAVSPLPHGVPLTLSSTVSAADLSHPAGTVEFFDGVTSLGLATSFDPTTGVATFTFTPDDGDHSFSARFTPTSGGYISSSSSSTPVHVNQAIAVNSALPYISGTVKVGYAATCSAGTWSGSGRTYRFRWFAGLTQLRDSGFGAAATYSSGVVAGTHALKALTCRVTVRNDGGDSTEVSSVPRTIAKGAAAKVKLPLLTYRPKITGILSVGRYLTGAKGTWSPVTTYSYAYTWKRYSSLRYGKPYGTGVKVSSSRVYKTVAKDKLKYLVLTVTAKRLGHFDGVASSAPVRVR